MFFSQSIGRLALVVLTFGSLCNAVSMADTQPYPYPPKTYVIYRDITPIPVPQPTRLAHIEPTPSYLINGPMRPPLPPVPQQMQGQPYQQPEVFVPENLRRMRIVQLAQAQLGLDKTTNRDYVNQTFSQGQDEAWCADFVSTILQWSGGSPWGHQAQVKSIMDWAVANQKMTSTPQPGDLVVFGDSTSPPNPYHIAILETINPDASVSTIGGNEGKSSAVDIPGFAGRVQRTTYAAGDSRIMGFIRPL